MATERDLSHALYRIDGRGYRAYKDIQGSYDFDGLSLHIDYVQGDPFASPSRMRLRVPQEAASFPEVLFHTAGRRIALQDFLARRVAHTIRAETTRRRGTGKSGLILIDVGEQEVLERTAILVTRDWVEARISLGLPAAGRRVLGGQAEKMLCSDLPAIAEQALRWSNTPQKEAQQFVECVENQDHIRGELEQRGLVAFVAHGSILPRQSGASEHPLKPSEAVPFEAPASLRVSFDLPNPIAGHSGEESRIHGMGIPKGVTVIVGGGYHGKSTLLRALERGVYPHVPGDGREYAVASRDAVKIRAEDGRRVEQVDISPFISNLPYGRSTTAFSSEDASGSTSQAANIVESLEAGATVLLLDEDTSATNFMVRDARMQALVHKEQEPITPFLDRVRELYEKRGVSTVLVMGGCGDYFDVADTIIMMRDYVPHEVTAEARRVAEAHVTHRRREVDNDITETTARIPQAESFDASRGRRDVKIDAKGLDTILYGRDPIDLRSVEQLVALSQTRAAGHAIHLATERFMDGRIALRDVLDALDEYLDRRGLDSLDPFRCGERHPGDFARPRKYEVAAAINRLRTVRMRQADREPEASETD